MVTLPLVENIPWVAALAGGLPVAAGTYLISKVFEDQVNQLSSGVYAVSGDLDNPRWRLSACLMRRPGCPRSTIRRPKINRRLTPRHQALTDSETAFSRVLSHCRAGFLGVLANPLAQQRRFSGGPDGEDIPKCRVALIPQAIPSRLDAMKTCSGCSMLLIQHSQTLLIGAVSVERISLPIN